MSGIGCNCAEQTLAHLGRPSCVFKIGQTRRLAFMHRLKADGTRNYLDLSSGTFDNAYWQALLTHVDPKQRLYLTPDLENVTHPNTERVVETFSSGYMAETRTAFLGFEGFLVDANATSPFSKEMNKMKCQDLAFFYIDNTGAVIGDASDWAGGKLYPIPVMRGSFDKERMLATDDATGKIKVAFVHDFYKFSDGDMGGLAGGLQAVSLNEVSPVLPVSGVVTTPTGTGFTVALKTAFIEGLGFAPITGLVAGDFVLTTAAGAPVVITSATETPDGTYAIVATLAAGGYLIGINVDSHIMTPVAFTVAP
jgi:hypothetical protein